MSRRILVTASLTAFALIGLTVPTASAHHAEPAPASSPDVVQVGTYAYLTAPDYDGLAPVATVLDGPTTIGLGTFDRLDGELVIVGGVGYRVGVDGTPQPVTVTASTPFAQAVAFRPTMSVPVPPGTTCAALDPLVAAAVGTRAAGTVAVRVRGTFANLTTRSVPAQSPPYLPLADVTATQTVFDLGQRRAVLVGFRSGPAAAGVGAPGLHLHGLTADRSAGGHVLSCIAGPDVQLSLEPVPAVRVVMPTAQ